MGRVFKKKVGSKREADTEEKEEIVKKKKTKEEETPEPIEEEDDEDEEEEEDVSDENEDVDDEEEEEEEGERQDFDFEAYAPADEDRDGIVNILTQTFLRTDIDLKAMSEKIIENAEGLVITQSYADDEETEDDYMVYAMATTLVLNETPKDDAPKYVKDIFAYLLNRAKKGAPKEIYKQLVGIQEAADGETALFISDRLLNFPARIVPPMFANVQTELAEKKYKTFIYISKLRIEETNGSAGAVSSSAGGSGGGKKKKMGKAAKKRAAAAALGEAEIEFDNSEDLLLFSLNKGKEVHFDIPVHMDVEPGSKFHIVEKDGKKWNPYRRITIMDADRLKAFLKKTESVLL